MVQIFPPMKRTIKKLKFSKKEFTEIFHFFHNLFEFHQDTPHNYLMSISQHSLQTAFLAEQKKKSHLLITSCLLHNVGQMIQQSPIPKYESGAKFLHSYFTEGVIVPIMKIPSGEAYLKDQKNKTIMQDIYFNDIIDLINFKEEASNSKMNVPNFDFYQKYLYESIDLSKMH